MVFVRIVLLPLSILYGLGVSFRNFLFNSGILKSKEFGIPVICVGNITVGGTGKTPHTEFLLAELEKDFRVACLSRGYKRRTSGFVLAGSASTAEEIGDEPLQIKNKFPGILVAVDEKRSRGIAKLMALPQPPEVIVLDDAFQHRYVKAGKNIVLMDYQRPVYKDCLLPAGRLRETPGALRRADYLIVSKCPLQLTPIEKRIIHKHLKIKPYQQLFFTRQSYGQIKGLYSGDLLQPPGHDASILCLTGIARPEPYIEYLRQFTDRLTVIRYPDHHRFTAKDIREIETTFGSIRSENKYLFTTEKDAMRLKSCPLSEKIREKIYYIPVEPEFYNKKELLIKELKEYVAKNKR